MHTGVTDPFLINWFNFLAFAFSGLPSDGTVAAAMASEIGPIRPLREENENIPQQATHTRKSRQSPQILGAWCDSGFGYLARSSGPHLLYDPTC